MSNAPAVDYAIRIIELFSESRQSLGIADISNSLQINKNAVFRILNVLLEHGWIYCCDPEKKKYELTLLPFSRLARHVDRASVQRLARPYIDELYAATGDYTYLGVPNGQSVVYTLHHEATGDVRLSGKVGAEYPLHCSAAGKALLSHMGEDAVRRYFKNGAQARTPNTITDAARFLQEAERIRKNGYALDLEEFGRGILCIAAPVFDADGAAAAAVGLSTLTIYHDERSLVAEKLDPVLTAARRISEALGCHCKCDPIKSGGTKHESL